MSGEKFWIDDRTGRVHKVHEFQEDPEIVRLRKKREAKAKVLRALVKQARKRNRRK